MSLVKEANYRPSQKEPFMNERQRDAIKLEGGVHMAETIRYLSERGIPAVTVTSA